jgi:SAM-dependent methyltransferase
MIQRKNGTSQENPILGILQSVYPPFAMIAGMQLDLFTPLKDAPMTAEQIAGVLGVSPTKLRPLLYALVVAKLLDVEGELFVNTDAANRFLVRGSQSCMVDCHELHSDLAAGRDLAARYDFSAYNTLLDVGGGSGGLAIAVTEAYPHIRATVVDLPTVTPIAARFIEEANACDRVQVMAADMLCDSLPGSYDSAALFSLIQTLSPDDARRIIMNVSGVVKPGGAIFIGGSGIIDDSRTSPPEKVGLNLVFINLYDEGQAYTEQEHRDWLTEANFEDFECTRLSEGRSIITARKIRRGVIPTS